MPTSKAALLEILLCAPNYDVGLHIVRHCLAAATQPRVTMRGTRVVYS